MKTSESDGSARPDLRFPVGASRAIRCPNDRSEDVSRGVGSREPLRDTDLRGYAGRTAVDRTPASPMVLRARDRDGPIGFRSESMKERVLAWGPIDQGVHWLQVGDQLMRVEVGDRLADFRLRK